MKVGSPHSLSACSYHSKGCNLSQAHGPQQPQRSLDPEQPEHSQEVGLEHCERDVKDTQDHQGQVKPACRTRAREQWRAVGPVVWVQEVMEGSVTADQTYLATHMSTKHVL
jgi:hypothetical protein